MFGRNTSAQPENKENGRNCLNPKKYMTKHETPT